MHQAGRERFRKQEKAANEWDRAAGIATMGPPRPPYAYCLTDDPRALPSVAAGGMRPGPAGMKTARDLIGASRVGGMTDFGLAPTPEPRGLPLGRETFQVAGATTLREPGKPKVDSLRQFENMVAFASPRVRPEELYESPRMMKHRDLRSAPQCLGFVYPSAKSTFAPQQAAASEGRASGASSRRDEYYPLSHTVLQAQYRVDDASHVT